MPLTDTGERTTDEDFNPRALARGSAGERVVVAASSEAVEDYGWGAVFSAAGRKYDAGDFQIIQGVKQVRVVSSDCNA